MFSFSFLFFIFVTSNLVIFVYRYHFSCLNFKLILFWCLFVYFLPLIYHQINIQASVNTRTLTQHKWPKKEKFWTRTEFEFKETKHRFCKYKKKIWIWVFFFSKKKMVLKNLILIWKGSTYVRKIDLKKNKAEVSDAFFSLPNKQAICTIENVLHFYFLFYSFLRVKIKNSVDATVNFQVFSTYRVFVDMKIS